MKKVTFSCCSNSAFNPCLPSPMEMSSFWTTRVLFKLGGVDSTVLKLADLLPAECCVATSEGRGLGFGHLWCWQPSLSLLEAKMTGVKRHQGMVNNHAPHLLSWNLERKNEEMAKFEMFCWAHESIFNIELMCPPQSYSSSFSPMHWMQPPCILPPLSTQALAQSSQAEGQHLCCTHFRLWLLCCHLPGGCRCKVASTSSTWNHLYWVG